MIKNSFLILLFSLCIASCMTDADEQCTTDDFDRGAMLNNWAENIIIPAYENYTNKLEDLKIDLVAFSDTPNQTNLDKARTSWLGAYIAWQKVALFQIGKAEVLRLRDYTNTYPLDAVGVENNIASDSYDLSLSTEMDKQGFPALDYLLNGVKDSDLEILNVYDNTANGLEDNFYNQIIADRDAFVVMRNELHSVVGVLKTNMIAALKIKADFNDTDGD